MTLRKSSEKSICFGKEGKDAKPTGEPSYQDLPKVEKICGSRAICCKLWLLVLRLG